MKKFICIAFLILGLLGIHSSQAAPPPHKGVKGPLITYKASYTLYWHGLKVGNSHHEVEAVASNPNHYVAKATSTPVFSGLPFKSSESSEFFWKGNDIRSLHYAYQNQEKSRYKTGSIDFDWQHKKIDSHRQNASPRTFNLTHNVFDKITHIFQLRQDLKAGKKELNYTVAEPAELRNYRYTILGEERLKTPIGILKTIHVEHISPNQERRTHLWLAKDLDYLMVKLQQVRKGKITAEGMIQTLKH